MNKQQRPIQVKRPADPKAGVTTARITVPLGPPPSETAYVSRHVETRFSTVEQRIAFRRLLEGLKEKGVCLSGGRPVTRPGDVLRWLMEQFTEQESGSD